MDARHRALLFVVLILLVATPVLAGCGATATPTVAPTTAPTQVPPTKVAPTNSAIPPSPVPTKVPPTSTPAPAAGGTLVFAQSGDVPTLDPQLDTWGTQTGYLGAALVALAPDNTYVPWLAESWTISTDGLTVDFVLRKDVKFHDGAPLTANDFVYTFNRAKDPATKSPAAGPMLAGVKTVEAPSTYALRLTLAAPSPILLLTLSSPAYAQPLEKAAIDKYGAEFGRHPVGVGPYVLKEWVTGTKLVLERNPDYSWGPSFAHKGPYYIQTIEFRVIPEEATILSGLEAGEIDTFGYVYPGAALQTKDVPRIRATGRFQIFEALQTGVQPHIAFNTSKPPFDDVKVRQAVDHGVDRDSLVKVLVGDGNGVTQCGPLSPSVIGYWDGADKAGCKQDVARAKSLMTQAGYTLGASGLFEKGGQPLKLDIIVSNAERARVATVLKEQLKGVGIELSIKQMEPASASKSLFSGDYQIAVLGWGYNDADILRMVLHSSAAGGGLNLYNVKDLDLDKLLEASATTVDTAKRMGILAQAQQRIVDQAYLVPLYAAKVFTVLSNKVKGAVFSKANNGLYLNDAYITTK